jgi:hypothetical protein
MNLILQPSAMPGACPEIKLLGARKNSTNAVLIRVFQIV